MIKEEGISSFFKGIIPSIIMTINPVIQYIIYESLKINVVGNDGHFSSSNIIWISLCSKFITTLITYPMLSIKTLFQCNDVKKTYEVLDLIQDLLETNGFKGFGVFSR